MTRRAVSPVLGLVLLLGLTTLGALSLFVVSSTVLGGPQHQAETAQAEQSLAQFADSADRIARQGDGTATYRVRGSDRGTVSVDGAAGHYEVRIERGGTTDVLTSGSLGAYRYVGPDDTVVAYQGGGVWRLDARGEARMVRPPEFHYRAGPEATLTLPVVRLEGAGTDAVPASGSMDVTEQRTLYPRLPDDANPMDNGTVYVEIGSRFCAGWESFFRDRTDGAIAETCDETGETAADELLVHLTVPFSFDGLGGDAAIARSITNTGVGAGGVTGPTDEGPHSLESVSGVVEARVADCDAGEGQPLAPTVDDPGLYCSSGISGGTYEFETHGGDVDVAVDGTFDPDRVEIRGDGNVTIFANGSVLPTYSDNVGNASHPDRLRIMVHSGEDVGWNGAGSSDIYALIYAPNSRVDFHGAVTITGGVVADEIELGGSAVIDGHPSVSDLRVQFDQGGEPFYYLHVSETVLTVEEA